MTQVLDQVEELRREGLDFSSELRHAHSPIGDDVRDRFRAFAVGLVGLKRTHSTPEDSWRSPSITSTTATASRISTPISGREH
jgi:hypothetical protein